MKVIQLEAPALSYLISCVMIFLLPCLGQNWGFHISYKGHMWMVPRVVV